MKPVIVGLDASERAPWVLDRAAALARAQGAKLVVLQAVAMPLAFPPEAFSVSPAALPALLLGLAQKSLDAAVASLPRELIERAEARPGAPWQVLCDAAREFASDVIVVGTHAHKRLDRVLGTTAARIVNHAPCSVLVVRDDSH